MKEVNKNKKGFVVLYTVLIASIILAISLGVSLVSYNEIVLSAEAREGNMAFFAADTGAECALYFDRVKEELSLSNFQCDGESGTGDIGNEFRLNGNQQCAVITINKTFEGNKTRIESRGYNVPCDEINTNPRAIERAVRVTYTNPNP